MPKHRETTIASNVRLLLVEPDFSLRASLRDVLAAEGRELWFAGSCAEARALIECSPSPHVAIIAVELPDGCGLNLIAELRRLAVAGECVALCARPTVESAARAMRLGATDYLTKPLGNGLALSNAVGWALARASKQQEQQRHEQNLVARVERYALALEATQDGLWDWDLETNSLYLSKRWKQILGFAEQEIGTSPDEWFSRVHPGDLSAVRAMVADRLSHSSGHFEIDYRIQSKFGAYLWVRTRGLSVQDAHKRTTRIAGIMSDISRAKKVEDRLVYEALHDGLTRLSNRVAFHQCLLEAFERQNQAKHEASFAVLFVDLDRFKNINDSLGHQAGDQFLLEISRRLQTSLRGSDHLARLGGDEFAILISGVNDMQDVAPILRRIETGIKAPCSIEGHMVVPSASIGIAFGSGHCASPEDVLRNADIAMYRAKGLGRGRAEVFDERMHVSALERFRLETDLRLALEADELEVHYQPVYSLRDKTLCGFEALVRWQHPERGWLPPEQFVRVAEDCELILSLGRWVLQTACKQLASWQASVGDALWMSVNLSPIQVFDANIVPEIAEALSTWGLRSQSLKLEITEGVFMGNMETATLILEEFKSLGVQLALDDFGTGYSSLSYLSRLPFDVLKIDRCFVDGLDRGGHSLVQAIVTMAGALDIRVIAEGIETTGQLDVLDALGCDFGQGYHFARPLGWQAASRLLSTSFGCEVRSTTSLGNPTQRRGQVRDVDGFVAPRC